MSSYSYGYEDIDYLNEDIRVAFNDAERRVYAFTGCVCGALAASPVLFFLLLKDNLKLGFTIYVSMILVYNFIFRILHKRLFGELLENDYQWGNRSYEIFEGKFLEKLYRKGRIDDDTYDYYLEVFDREQCEEYEWEYRRYIKRTRKFTIIFTLLALAPSLIYTIGKVKGMI